MDPAKGVTTQEQALQGAIDIIAEWIWGNFEYRKVLREMLWNEGSLVSSVVPAKVGQKTKYTMYYERKESVTTIPSHRVLAIRRGCKEGILISSIEGDNAKALDYLLNCHHQGQRFHFRPHPRDCRARKLQPHPAPADRNRGPHSAEGTGRPGSDPCIPGKPGEPAALASGRPHRRHGSGLGQKAMIAASRS